MTIILTMFSVAKRNQYSNNNHSFDILIDINDSIRFHSSLELDFCTETLGGKKLARCMFLFFMTLQECLKDKFLTLQECLKDKFLTLQECPCKNCLHHHRHHHQFAELVIAKVHFQQLDPGDLPASECW